MKKLISELEKAKLEVLNIQMEIAEMIARSEETMQLIEQGLVKPVVSMALIKRASRIILSEAFNPYDRSSEVRLVK